MSKTKTKRTVLVNTGKVFDDQTGEIIEPKSDDYRIIIEDISNNDDVTKGRFMKQQLLLNLLGGME